MFIRKKELETLHTSLDEKFKQVDERLELLEYIMTKIINKIEDQDKVVENDIKIQTALTDRTLDNSKVVNALLKSDEDRIKALNLTMEHVEEVVNNVGILVKILNEKGFITIEDLKEGD